MKTLDIPQNLYQWETSQQFSKAISYGSLTRLCIHLEHNQSAVIVGDRNSNRGCPGGSVVMKVPANAGDMGSIPRSGKSPGEGNGNTLHYSCQGNPTDKGAWRNTAQRVTKELDTT